MLKTSLGGNNRIGSGRKMDVEMRSYSRSTHDRGYLFRTTASMGTLIPFMKQIATPGATFDIHLMCEIMTHPTVGPLFGSAKVQLDVFQAPVRLYQGQLHNNKLNIGRNMSAVKLPIMTLQAEPFLDAMDEIIPLPDVPNLDTAQINPSSLLAYLGIMGVGNAVVESGTIERNFHALWLLMYWDVYKNYYANRQEEIGKMIWTAPFGVVNNMTAIEINGSATLPFEVTAPFGIKVTFTGSKTPWENIIVQTTQGEFPLTQVAYPTDRSAALFDLGVWKWYLTGNVVVTGYRSRRADEIPETTIHVETIALDSIDQMREAILAWTENATPFSVNDAAFAIGGDNPYSKILDWVGNASPYQSTQQGLALKTYQSDLFNNWLNTDWIDDPVTGVNARSSVDTTGGSFTMDALALAEKLWEMLNRITTAGGSYKDWLDAVYTDNYYGGIETPVYHGSLIKELVFQEVVSNSESAGENGGTQPLGTLAGKGVLSKKNKGGRMTIKTDEHCLIMGIFSVTPRIDYSQGNDWDTYALLTMDDFHKPALDQIGFQELIQEQMAWWSTSNTGGSGWQQLSTGKQPSWTNYMTEVNKIKGNFAIPVGGNGGGEMFMVLTRKYEPGAVAIQDMTTYIDPSKFNDIFAQTSLDAQNLWVQIAVDIEARQLMSAKQMPSM